MEKPATLKTNEKFRESLLSYHNAGTLEKAEAKSVEAVTPQHVVTQGSNVLKTWLQKNFRNEGTKNTYVHSMIAWTKAIRGKHLPITKDNVNKYIDEYLLEADKGKRNFLDDFAAFLQYMVKVYAPTSIQGYSSVAKLFFNRHGLKLTEEQWKDFTRHLIPASVPVTQDEIFTKEQIRILLSHLKVRNQAITLFLISTGARIGETLQLTIDDIDLEADPPKVHFKPHYTKKGVGARTMWFSYETRDRIKEWLKIRERKKHNFTNPKALFGNATRAFDKAYVRGLSAAQLDKQDSASRFHIYHIHTLRKFFSTTMSEAGVQESVVHAWMGHKGYLDAAYKRYTKQKLGEMYKEHMGAVSVFIQEQNGKGSQQLIDEGELQKYLEMGWKFKGTLPSGKIIVEGNVGMLRPSQLEPVLPETVKPEVPKNAQIEEPLSDKKDVRVEYVYGQKVEIPKTSTEKTKWFGCPYSDNWVTKEDCEKCRKRQFNVWSDCYNERQKNPNNPIFKPSKPQPN